MDEPPFCVPRDSDGRLERRGGALSRSAPARLHRRSRSSDSGWIRWWTRIVIDAARRLLGLGAEAQERPVGMPWLRFPWWSCRSWIGWSFAPLVPIACSWLSLTTLLRLVLNAVLGWWWAAPLMREGLDGLRGDDSNW